MKSKFKATIIGLILSVPGIASLFMSEYPELAGLMVIPLVSMLPISLPLEMLGDTLFNEYQLTALFGSFVLLTLFLLSTILYLRRVYQRREQQRSFSNIELFGYFGLQIFILHPLVFDIWAYKNADHSGDGQFMFGTFETFPISSALFILLGLTIDLIKNKKQLPQ